MSQVETKGERSKDDTLPAPTVPLVVDDSAPQDLPDYSPEELAARKAADKKKKEQKNTSPASGQPWKDESLKRFADSSNAPIPSKRQEKEKAKTDKETEEKKAEDAKVQEKEAHAKNLQGKLLDISMAAFGAATDLISAVFISPTPGRRLASSMISTTTNSTFATYSFKVQHAMLRDNLDLMQSHVVNYLDAVSKNVRMLMYSAVIVSFSVDISTDLGTCILFLETIYSNRGPRLLACKADGTVVGALPKPGKVAAAPVAAPAPAAVAEKKQ